MKHIGKFPIRVIGIIDRRLFDVKQKKKKKYGIQFFRIFFFFSKKLLKFIEYIEYLTIREEEFELKILFCIFFSLILALAEKPFINNAFIFN